MLKDSSLLQDTLFLLLPSYCRFFYYLNKTKSKPTKRWMWLFISKWGFLLILESNNSLVLWVMQYTGHTGFKGFYYCIYCFFNCFSCNSYNYVMIICSLIHWLLPNQLIHIAYTSSGLVKDELGGHVVFVVTTKHWILILYVRWETPLNRI